MLPLENPKVTSEYGIIRSDKKIHKGIDLISTSGDRNVKAIADGRVSFCGYDSTGFGNYVSILHKDLHKSLYCHLKSYDVVQGQEIKEGQVIGIEGMSGNSTGIHLHLEIREAPYKTDNHINVANYLGIKNQKGKAEFMFKEGQELEAIDYLVKQGRITDKEQALQKLDLIKNECWTYIKWANDVKMLDKQRL